MAYAQLTWRESLRDIEATLGANPTKLYAMGLRQAVHRSTLADANEQRDWPLDRMFALQDPITAPVLASKDAREGALAFAERRPPVWGGE